MDTLRFEWPGEVPVDGRALAGRLDNGLSYFILPHREPPNRVSMRLAVAVGSLMEREDQRGLAHFLEHIAFCGSENFSRGDLIEYLQRMGMKFGHHSNAYTDFTETVYKLELPDGGRQSIKDGLLVLRDYLCALTIDGGEVERERGVILSELRYVDSPQYRDALERCGFLFPCSILRDRFPIGERAVIEELDGGRMREFYEKFYAPSTAALLIVGDVDPSAVERVLKFIFGDIPVGPKAAAQDIGSFAVTGTRVKLHREPELPQTYVSICCLCPLENFKDCRATRREKLLQCLGSAILTRRLEILSKGAEAPFIGGEAEASRSIRNAVQVAAIQLSAKAETVCETLRVAERELRRALDYGFTEGEAERARREMASQYRNARLQANSLRASRLADSWVGAICNGLSPTSTEWDDDFAKEVLAEATAERIGDAFRRLWAPKNRSIYISGNLPENLTENVVRGTYSRSLRSILRPPAADGLGTFSYGDFGSAGTVTSRSEDKELGLRQMQFANGVRLNIRRTDFEAGQLHLKVRFGHGLLSQPKDSPGLNRFAEWAFTEGGLGRHSMEELRDLTAGHVLSADFSVESNSFSLTGRTTAQDLLLQLQLLAAYVSDPGFRPEGEMVARKLIPQVYVELDHTAEGALSRHGERFLHGGDCRFGYPERKVMESYGSEELRRWLEPELRSGYLEISAVGDVDPDELESAVAATFGALRRREGKPAELPVAMALPRGECGDFTYDSEIAKGLVLVYWPTDDRRNIPQKRHLDMLSDILEDRLRLRVRKEMGDAYSPHASHAASATFEHYGYIRACALVDVDRVNEVAYMIHDIGKELQKTGPSGDEFLRVHKPALTEIRELLRKNSYWLCAIDGCQAYPDTLQYIRTMQSFYENAKVEDLRDVLDFLDSGSAITIKVRPEKHEPKSTTE